MRNDFGLSLLELLVTISIITLLLTLGVPAVLSAQKSMQLKGVLEVSYFAFQQARSSAISTQKDISIVFNSAANWCLAISDKGQCDCTVYQDCTIDGVEQVIKASDFHLITMQDVKFGVDHAAIFDGIRGLAIGHAGSTVFSDGDNQAKLILSNMGRVRICISQGSLGSYSPC